MKVFYKGNDARFMEVYNGVISSQPIEVDTNLFTEYLRCICLVTHDSQHALQYIKQHEGSLTITTEHYNLLLESCKYGKDTKQALKFFKVISFRKQPHSNSHTANDE